MNSELRLEWLRRQQKSKLFSKLKISVLGFVWAIGRNWSLRSRIVKKIQTSVLLGAPVLACHLPLKWAHCSEHISKHKGPFCPSSLFPPALRHPSLLSSPPGPQMHPPLQFELGDTIGATPPSIFISNFFLKDQKFGNFEGKTVPWKICSSDRSSFFSFKWAPDYKLVTVETWKLEEIGFSGTTSNTCASHNVSHSSPSLFLIHLQKNDE